ncbi:MAG: hypothetical protein AAGA77_18570 [Bacteroidota bacterium]
MKNRNLTRSIARFSMILACFCFAYTVEAQENVGIGTNNPHPTAKLDVVSFDQGILVPRLKEAWRLGIEEPANGLLVYDITYNAFFVYSGGWKKIIDESQIPAGDHISDADNDTYIHTESTPDKDVIDFQVGGTDMGYMDGKTFHFQSPGNSLFIGENAGVNDDGINNRNIFIGESAGSSTTTGWQNLMIGYHAGEGNVDGENNLMIGLDAGKANESGSQNLFLGHNAGKNLEDEDWNLMIGYDAGREIESGTQNVFIGHIAGRDSESSNTNVVIGTGAGVDITNSAANVMIGTGAGQANGSGKNNVLLGSFAGSNSVNKSDNVLLGAETGFLAGLGGRNVFVGAQAGRNNLGENNIFIGYHSGKWEEGSNKFYLDNSDTDEPLLYGQFDTDELQVNGALKIKDEYTFPLVDGADGEILSTDGNGLLQWIPNELSTTVVEDLDKDTKVQVEELPDEDVIRFDLEGNEAMVLDKNAFGMARLILNPVNSSVLIGNGAGENNEGFTNVFVGKDAGQGNGSGFGNTFIGSSAGFLNIDGEHNTYMGLLAGHINNGSENVMLGQGAGSEVYYGNQNVLIGNQAGQHGNLASRNVKIGYQAGANDLNDDKLFIENSGSNAPLIYGDFQEDYLTFNGKVGVYANPNAQLHVRSFTTNPAVRVEVNDQTKLLVTEGGGVAIGADAPERTPFDGLYVEGQVNLGAVSAAGGYKLSVDGRVICEELRVEDSGDWPDYVFLPDYDLQSLEKVDAYIQSEGHLPNIPSAKIIEAEGFDTGDMVKRLLEKIEELTLHTIRQQKEIDALKKKY